MSDTEVSASSTSEDDENAEVNMLVPSLLECGMISILGNRQGNTNIHRLNENALSFVCRSGQKI